MLDSEKFSPLPSTKKAGYQAENLRFVFSNLRISQRGLPSVAPLCRYTQAHCEDSDAAAENAAENESEHNITSLLYYAREILM